MWNRYFKIIKMRISTGNHFEEEDFHPDELWRRRNSSSLIHVGDRYHLILWFRLYVHCTLVAVWWKTNKRSFCFIIAFHDFATMENRLTYQCPSSWPVVITMKKKLAGTLEKKYRILAGPNEWQQVCNRSNPEKTSRSCEEAGFSWLSSKVSRTLTVKCTNDGVHVSREIVGKNHLKSKCLQVQLLIRWYFVY
jgi:hypothetical protein